MLLATTAPILGYATFGKRDGFEIFSMGGLLRQFQDGDAKNILRQSIQLRLEDIRIFEHSEIWGFSRIFWKNNWIHLFLHYKYALDIYNRDGYHAAAIALREVWANEADIIACLRTAVSSIDTPPSGFSIPWNHHVPVWPDNSNSSQQAFLHLPDNEPRTPGLLYQMAKKEPYNRYPKLWASSSLPIFQSISSTDIDLISPKPLLNGASLFDTETKEEEYLPIFHPDNEDSLIYSYEDAGDSFWRKKDNSPTDEIKSKTKALKDFFKAFISNIRKT